MPILSEGKGVMLWLSRRGHNQGFSQYILNQFKKETNIGFYEVSFRPNDGKDFAKFTSWYQKQDLKELKKQYDLFFTLKKQAKKDALSEYYNSDTHRTIIENIDIPRNKMFDEFFKGKISFDKFADCYKWSKNFFKS